MTQPTLPLVLVVDDDRLYQAMVRSAIGNTATLVQALTLDEAETAFRNHGDTLAAILMDGMVPDEAHLSLPLVKLIREAGYRGPVIANSSSARICRALETAGCDYSGHGIKTDGPTLLIGILETIAAQPTA